MSSVRFAWKNTACTQRTGFPSLAWFCYATVIGSNSRLIGGYIVRHFYFKERSATERHPAGWTVSKRDPLPAGDFRINEFGWGQVSLWFVAADRFTAEERQEAYHAFLKLTQE
jgi:hypothetical protein